jgi:hypothetical protein
MALSLKISDPQITFIGLQVEQASFKYRLPLVDHVLCRAGTRILPAGYMQQRCQGVDFDQRQFQMKCWLYLLTKVFNDCETLIGIFLMSFYYLDVKI